MEDKRKFQKSRTFQGGEKRGKPFQKGNGKKFKRLDPEVKEKANKLVQKNGIPFRYALEVARGKKKLPEVLAELLQKNKIEQIMKKHDLTRAMAGQVIGKKIALDEALQILSFRKMKIQFSKRSCFQESCEKKLPFVFFFHGSEKKIGLIQTNDKYDIDFIENGTEEVQRIPKLLVKLAFAESSREKIEPQISLNSEIAGQKLQPIQRIVERNRIKDSQLRRYLFGEKPVKFTTLEGDVLEGKVLWFNLYEIYVELGDQTCLYLLRHCLYSWEEVGGAEPTG